MKFFTTVRGLNCLLSLLLVGLGLRIVSLLTGQPSVAVSARLPTPAVVAKPAAPALAEAAPALPPVTWPDPPLTGYPAVAASAEFQQQLGLALRQGVLRKYTALLPRLQLDASQQERFLTLLYVRTIAPEIAPDPLSPPSLPDALAAYHRYNSRMEALLGPAKAAQFQAYEHTLPAANLVSKIDFTLAAAGTGLDASAKAAVTAAVQSFHDPVAEQVRALGSVDQIRATLGGSATAYLTEAMVRQARPALSELQAQVLNEIFAQQEARRAAEAVRLAVGASRDANEI